MPCDYQALPHSGIQTLAPYIPGKSAEQLAREQGLTDIIKLASNENPLGCSANVSRALAKLSGVQIATYPAPASHPLHQKLSDKLSLHKDMLTLGNGSDALFPLLLTCFALHNDKHVMLHDYAFISYAIHAKTLGIPVVSVGLRPNWEVDIDAMVDLCNEKTALIFLANPNNPLGVLVPHEGIQRLLDNIPASTIVVLDEAYFEYIDSQDNQSSLSLLKHYPNLIITRTFSKAYGLAGLRLGYAIANPPITSILQRAQPPFTVNQAALTAASAALDDEQFIKDSVEANKMGLKQLKQGLAKLQLNCLPTAGNFITFDYRQDANSLYQDLQQHGIIVRPLHPYGLNNYIRVTVGTKEQNNRFLDTMSIIKKEGITS